MRLPAYLSVHLYPSLEHEFVKLNVLQFLLSALSNAYTCLVKSKAVALKCISTYFIFDKGSHSHSNIHKLLHICFLLMMTKLNILPSFPVLCTDKEGAGYIGFP